MKIVFIFFTKSTKRHIGSIERRIKLRRLYKTIIVQINLLEPFLSAVVAVVPLHRLFQADQPILVQVKAEEVLHHTELNQILGVEATVGFGDGFVQRSFPSLPIRAEFVEPLPAQAIPINPVDHPCVTVATKNVATTLVVDIDSTTTGG